MASPRKATKEEGIQYLNQFPKYFITPYGEISATNDEVMQRRIKPTNCEWYIRPKIAASEMADTFQKCLPHIKNSELMDKDIWKKVEKETTDLTKTLKKMNIKDNLDVSREDVKQLIESLKDNANKDIFDALFELGHSLFSIAIHYKVASYLVSNVKDYATHCNLPDNNDRDFKAKPSKKSLAKMWKNMIARQAGSVNTTATTSRRSLSAVFGSKRKRT